jgi:uroporphyrinogen-III synthase
VGRASPVRALITRPREDAGTVVAALQSRGFTVQVEPLLDIVFHRGVALPVTGAQGFLATSANGVRALAANDAPRDLPLWAVGDATARTAREAGFAQVTSAGGDVQALARLVAERVDPAAGALLHGAGTKVAGDLAGLLAADGFEVRRVVLYEARQAAALSPSLLAALDGEHIDLALFFSPRTAATFVTLGQAAGRAERCRRIRAFALSAAVAQALTALPWARVVVAGQPDQDALLAAIDAEDWGT